MLFLIFILLFFFWLLFLGLFLLMIFIFNFLLLLIILISPLTIISLIVRILSIVNLLSWRIQRMQNIVKKIINLICACFPSLGILISFPTLWELISIKTIHLNLSIFMIQLVFSIIQMQNYSTATMIPLTMETWIHTVSTWFLFTEQTFPSWWLIFVTHWTFYWCCW